MYFHLLSGTVRANLVSLACFRVRSATVFPRCPFIGKPFLHSGNIYHHRFFCEVHNLLSSFCKKNISVDPFCHSYFRLSILNLWFTPNHFKLNWVWMTEWIIHFLSYVSFSNPAWNWNEKTRTPGHSQP